MKKQIFIGTICWVIVAGLSLIPFEAGYGQIWKRMKKKIQKKVEQKVEDAAERTAEAAIDSVEESLVKEGSTAASGISEGNGAQSKLAALKAVFPERLNGFVRQKLSASQQGMMGFKVAQAQAVYSQDGKEIEISLLDYGNAQLVAMMGAAWLQSEIYEEDESGYKKTTTFQGFPAYEEYQKADAHSEVSVVLENQLMLNAEAQGMTPDELKQVLAQLNWNQLRQLATSGGVTGERKEPVDFKVLKAALPESLPGFERRDVRGSKRKAMGIVESKAEGTYVGGEKRLVIEIVDSGSMEPWSRLAAAWGGEMEEEWEGGYKKVHKIKGYAATETFERSPDGSTRGSLEVLVGRFKVRIEGENITPEDLHRAFQAVLPTLEELKDS